MISGLITQLGPIKLVSRQLCTKRLKRSQFWKALKKQIKSNQKGLKEGDLDQLWTWIHSLFHKECGQT